ncbi:MAG: spermidine synthase [Alcaligenaceae bacterium]|nr:spermidine synthase [Alcaligenaceae bacterium]
MSSEYPPFGDLPTLSEENGIRFLHFDSEWVQGAMRISRPSELVLAYTRQMMAWLLFLTPRARDRVGILGLGAGSLLRYMIRHTPAQVHTVERNEQVTAMCRAFFRLPGSARSVIDHDDAAHWIAQPDQNDRFMALMVDLYDAGAQGPVCDSQEFYLDCYHALAEVGIMTVNLFGRHESYAHNIRHISKAFKGRVLCLPEIDEGNVVVLAFKGPVLDISSQRLLDRAHDVEQRHRLPAIRWARELLSADGETWRTDVKI